MNTDPLNPFDDVLPETSQPEPVEIVLTDEQKKFIDTNWEKMDLMAMTRTVFKNEAIKGTSREGRAVRAYLVSKNYKYVTTQDVRREVKLTDEQKEFIGQYASTMKPYEIARVLFKDEKLAPATKEALVVQAYIKELSPIFLKKDDEYTDDEYAPPKTFKNMYAVIKEIAGYNVEEEKLNTKTRRAIEKCMEFCGSPRFMLTASNLKNLSERSMFEKEYIRSVWDKPDLTTDEVNMYVSLIYEYVIQDRIHRIVGKLNMLLESVTEDKEGKISMSLSDSIKGKSEELHQSITRQKQYTETLNGRRSTRLESMQAKSKSLVSLVEAMKEEADRKQILRFAELRRKKVSEELTRLETEDEFNARIFGISREEILE